MDPKLVYPYADAALPARGKINGKRKTSLEVAEAIRRAGQGRREKWSEQARLGAERPGRSKIQAVMPDALSRCRLGGA
jgi:hypothetical protein